ncbi:MAG: MarR family transcriptional regulator [Ignavibacteria bacterium]|nr:MarR family transcriptional regulator [Ignavibacteria bacterium]MBK6419694.1 MarR family transcriptional regulator [Ignavibacteria bacterium]MBK6759674.1 MarR family transcriptional regulator [Ignavibacteria bacterium]MBK7184565.1 MarR family transcriptional regulator [Ignavibacteria bacterium]MBK7413367.1 MarR family transcriptional regulator [Ignavibacteria bacterium]
MGEALKQRLKQERFSSPYQEAMLAVMVCADRLNRGMDETCERHGITSAQYNVLRILRGVYPDGHPRCEIITRMIHVAPDVTRLIDRLEKLDLVERSKSEQDLRLSLSVITQKGLDLLVSIQPEIDALEEQLSKGLTVQEAGLLADLCDKVTSAIE